MNPHGLLLATRRAQALHLPRHHVGGGWGGAGGGLRPHVCVSVCACTRARGQGLPSAHARPARTVGSPSVMKYSSSSASSSKAMRNAASDAVPPSGRRPRKNMAARSMEDVDSSCIPCAPCACACVSARARARVRACSRVHPQLPRTSSKHLVAVRANAITLNMHPRGSCSLMTRMTSRTTKRSRCIVSRWLVANLRCACVCACVCVCARVCVRAATHAVSIDMEWSTRNTTRLPRTVPTSGERGYGFVSRSSCATRERTLRCDRANA